MTVVASKLSQVYPHLVEHLSDAEREYLASLLVLRRASREERRSLWFLPCRLHHP